MARKKGLGENASGYFRQLYADNPGWLKEKSNEQVMAKFRADHGLADDAEVPKKFKDAMANIKSVLRKKAGLIKKGGKRGGRRAKVAVAVAGNSAPAAPSGRKLEALEEMIDECMTFAKAVDREGLDEVIRRLRRARNAVVWKLGQPD